MRANHSRTRVLALTTLAITLAMLGTVRTGAQGPPGVKAVQLDPVDPGVLIDPARGQAGQAYVMNPEGGIDAVGLDKGQTIWKTTAAARPLAVMGDRLIGQAEASPSANVLKIVALDLAKPQQAVLGAEPLPEGMKPSVDETRAGRFVAEARPSGKQAIITYEFHSRPRGGIPPGARERLQMSVKRGSRTPVAADQPREAANRGGFRFDPTDGSISPLTAADAAPRPPEGVESVVAKTPSSPSGSKYLSADGRHHLVSKRTGNDFKPDEKYTLTVHDLESDKPLGQFKSPSSRPPFLVVGTSDVLIKLPGEPVETNTERRLPTLRRVHLDSGAGEMVWEHPIRDTSPRDLVAP